MSIYELKRKVMSTQANDPIAVINLLLEVVECLDQLETRIEGVADKVSKLKDEVRR